MSEKICPHCGSDCLMFVDDDTITNLDWYYQCNECNELISEDELIEASTPDAEGE